jgi:lysophospholipase L1-like esterase
LSFTWNILVDDQFTRSNSSAGSPGNNWIDANHVSQINGNTLLGIVPTQSSSLRLLAGHVVRPSNENQTNQKIILTTDTSTALNNAFNVILRYIDDNNFYVASMDSTSGSMLIQKVVAGTATTIKSTAITWVSGHVMSLELTATGTSSTTLISTFTDVTAGGPPVVSTSATDNTAAMQTSGGYGINLNYINSNVNSRVARVQTYYDNTASMTVSPSLLSTLLGAQTVTVTGTGTSFAGTPFTLLSTGSIVSTTINSTTSATLSVNPGSTPSSILLKDTNSGALAYLPVALPTLVLSPTYINALSTANSISVTGTAPVSWTPGTPGSPTLTIGGTASIVSQVINTSTTATLSVDAGSIGEICAITDPNSGATANLDVLAPLLPGDPDLGMSPYNWYVNGGYATANNVGAYLKYAFTGSNTYIDVDTSKLVSASTLAANYPTICYRVNSNPAVSYKILSTDTRLAISANQLSVGDHTVQIWFQTQATGDRWTSPVVNAVRFSQVVCNGTFTTPDIRPKNILAFWDSIGAGYSSDSLNAALSITDGMKSSLQGVGLGLDGEIGTVVFNGHGLTVAASGSVPKFYDSGTPANSSWHHYSSGASRLVGGLLDPQPDYIINLLGVNDGLTGASDADVRAAVSGWLTDCRAAAPNTPIFMFVNTGRYKITAITNGYNDYKAVAPYDNICYLVDMGTEVSIGLTGGGSNSWGSADSTHPRTFIEILLSAAIVNACKVIKPGNFAG